MAAPVAGGRSSSQADGDEVIERPWTSVDEISDHRGILLLCDSRSGRRPLGDLRRQARVSPRKIKVSITYNPGDTETFLDRDRLAKAPPAKDAKRNRYEIFLAGLTFNLLFDVLDALRLFLRFSRKRRRTS